MEGFEIKDDRHWQAKVKVPLGLGGLKMTIDFEKLEERELEFASMNAKGKGVGAMMNMTTSFTLSGEGEHTSMAWSADVKIAGPVGSMGQRVLQPIINQQVGNVLTALEAKVAEAKAARRRACDSPPRRTEASQRRRDMSPEAKPCTLSVTCHGALPHR